MTADSHGRVMSAADHRLHDDLLDEQWKRSYYAVSVCASLMADRRNFIVVPIGVRSGLSTFSDFAGASGGTVCFIEVDTR